MMSRCRLALVGALLLLPNIAVAEEPVETALREKVAAIDALPDWSASYGRLTYDRSTDTATLVDFVARTETLGTDISIASLSVTGYAESPDGSFKVTSVLADGGVVKVGFVTVEVRDVGIENLIVPLMNDVVFTPSKPFTSMVKLYGEAIKARFDRARVGSVAVVELYGPNQRSGVSWVTGPTLEGAGGSGGQRRAASCPASKGSRPS